jgi:transposase-like protein
VEAVTPKVAASLLEAGEELLTFYRFPASQWKALRTTNAIERLHAEFRRRVKTQGSLPDTQTAEVLLFGLLASGQIRMRRIDGWEDMDQIPVHRSSKVA